MAAGGSGNLGRKFKILSIVWNDIPGFFSRGKPVTVGFLQRRRQKRTKQNTKKTHWLVDIPSWSPVWPERHFEFDHSLHLRALFWICSFSFWNRVLLVIRFGPKMGLDKGDEFKVANVEEEAELHEFVCEECGFTLFPARGREGKFFADRCGWG